MVNSVEGSLSNGVKLETQNHWWPRYLSRTAGGRHIKEAVAWNAYTTRRIKRWQEQSTATEDCPTCKLLFLNHVPPTCQEGRCVVVDSVCLALQRQQAPHACPEVVH
jgi:hypothetical protein